MESRDIENGLAGCSVYQVFFRLERPRVVAVGRLGRFRFGTGWYFYTGSARRAIEARIQRHLSRDKKPRWHIDWLLAGPNAEVDFVLAARGDAVGGECGLHQRALMAFSAATPAPGLGASDCRGGCPSHLGQLSRAVFPERVVQDLGLGNRPGVAKVIVPEGNPAIVQTGTRFPGRGHC
jgi:Uri superfamily endonuclease